MGIIVTIQFKEALELPIVYQTGLPMHIKMPEKSYRSSRLLLVVSIGMLDEILQSSIARREPSLRDLCSDMAAVAPGLWLVRWLLSRLIVDHD